PVDGQRRGQRDQRSRDRGRAARLPLMRGRDRTVLAMNQKDNKSRTRFYRAVGRSLRCWLLRGLILLAAFAVCRAVFAAPASPDAPSSFDVRTTHSLPR